MYLYEVYVTNESLNVNQSFSYYHLDKFELYTRVKVKFHNSDNVAIIVERKFTDKTALELSSEFGYTILEIKECIDEKPVLNAELFELAKWLSKTTVSPLISCINTLLPKALRTSKNIKGPKMCEYVHLTGNNAELSEKQANLLDQLFEGMEASAARKISVSLFNKLIEKKAVEVIRKEYEYKNNVIDKTAFKTLTDEQLDAYNSFVETDKMVSLLYGVTGSGKTEVYLHLARYYLAQGKEVLILVPEISLTPQMIQRVKERFEDVIFYHSELSDQERYEQYHRVLEGKVKIVVGTRSSVFLPFSNLGLVIIDEEHDSSYKQDSSPCYSARNVAIRRAYDFHAKVLLASATPSLDSYTRALKGEFNLMKLKNRINLKMPDIEIVSLADEIKSRGSYIISRRLLSELKQTVSNHKQAIILLNRRGYSPIVKCTSCSKTLMCNDCDVPLNYHKDSGLLVCHACSKAYKKIDICPYCGKKTLMQYGFGTERVEEEIHKLIPEVRTLRMDRDTTSRKGTHKAILDAFGEKKADILIGTQMISKGLDYPDVTLVGILNGDAGLMHQDYNSSKLTFDLLMQASGRSGRADSPGKVIIQAYDTEHYAIKAVLKQDYEYFFNIEMSYREKAKYPPYSHIIAVYLSDTDRSRISESSDYLKEELRKSDYKVLNPLELNRIQSLFRIRIMLFCPSLKEGLDTVNSAVEKYIKRKVRSNIKVDVDPLYLE